MQRDTINNSIAFQNFIALPMSGVVCSTAITRALYIIPSETEWFHVFVSIIDKAGHSTVATSVCFVRADLHQLVLGPTVLTRTKPRT